ncbi:hypothetical protein ACVWWO_003215 [Bradyrhizobium sp. F1.13.1]
MNALSSTLRALTLPEQWIAWAGKVGSRSVRFGAPVPRSHSTRSEVRLTARADLS